MVSMVTGLASLTSRTSMGILVVGGVVSDTCLGKGQREGRGGSVSVFCAGELYGQSLFTDSCSAETSLTKDVLPFPGHGFQKSIASLNSPSDTEVSSSTANREQVKEEEAHLALDLLSTASGWL